MIPKAGESSEQRKHWIAGLSPANVIALLVIVSTGAVAWGVEITQTKENSIKIVKVEQEAKRELLSMEERITVEIIQSEQRTNDRLERMEKRIGNVMKEIKRAITNNNRTTLSGR